MEKAKVKKSKEIKFGLQDGKLAISFSFRMDVTKAF
jgi:hypothetical protein